MDDDDLEMLRSSTRAAIDAAKGGSALRARLDEDGWFELWEAEERAATTVLFEELGRALAPSNLLDDVILGLLTAGAPTLDAGIVRFLYPAPGDGARASSVLDPHAGVVHLRGQVLALPEGGTDLVAPVFSGEEGFLAVVSAPAVQALDGIDLDAGRGTVDIQVSLDGLQRIELDHEAWDRSVALARRALAIELVGVASAMLDLAVEHVVERHQFGRPLGSFQAVQLRLADVAIALAAARAAIDATWAEPSDLVCAMAKSLAATAHEVAARECQQVLGGIGFTWEHPFHRYLRRGMALDALLGTARDLEQQIGARLVASGTVPRLPFDIDPVGR